MKQTLLLLLILVSTTYVKASPYDYYGTCDELYQDEELQQIKSDLLPIEIVIDCKTTTIKRTERPWLVGLWLGDSHYSSVSAKYINNGELNNCNLEDSDGLNKIIQLSKPINLYYDHEERRHVLSQVGQLLKGSLNIEFKMSYLPTGNNHAVIEAMNVPICN